ncbi:MAG: hypothetical protein K2G45_12610 [Lachnospiraceae bacterium]|nr:hypothetical protein [Lachnospiraceae bacterium]
MILKIYRSSVMNNDNYTAFEEEIENTDIPLLSVCHVVGMVNTFIRHYPGGFLQMMGDDELPYLLIDGKLEWNVLIETATVRDFLATHPQCYKEGIYVESGYPAAGGPGRILAVTAWELFCIFLQSRGIELGFPIEAIGLLVPTILEIKDYFAKKNVRPVQLTDRLVQLSEVGALEMAEQLGLDVPTTIRLLIGFGYKRDEKSGKFILKENERQKALNLLCELEAQEKDVK